MGANPGSVCPHLPTRPSPGVTYATKTGPKAPMNAPRPTTMPPTRDELRLLQPGQEVIHSNPLNTQIDKLSKALFVQRENQVLSKMRVKVQGKLVTVTPADIMNSGDVVLYTKNKIHQKWMMGNKHL